MPTEDPNHQLPEPELSQLLADVTVESSMTGQPFLLSGSTVTLFSEIESL